MNDEKKKKIFLFSSLEGSTLNEVGLKQRNTKLKCQYNLAQQNPAAFFEELKTRLLAYQTKNYGIIEDDPSMILDLQIAKTIDDADNYLFENSINYITRYDSGVGTDSSEKFVWKQINKSRNFFFFCFRRNYERLIDVIWYPSLDSNNALLSTIPSNHNQLTFKQFRQLFKKQTAYKYRYFFKTTCTPDINKEQYVFRELTMDDELIPFYNGKIFVQLDRLC